MSLEPLLSRQYWKGMLSPDHRRGDWHRHSSDPGGKRNGMGTVNPEIPTEGKGTETPLVWELAYLRTQSRGTLGTGISQTPETGAYLKEEMGTGIHDMGTESIGTGREYETGITQISTLDMIQFGKDYDTGSEWDSLDTLQK